MFQEQQQYYLTQPPRWRDQQQLDENGEEKVNEDCDLEIPSPRAEPIIEEEDDAVEKAEAKQNGDGGGAKSDRRKFNHKHHSRNQEMSNNLSDIKENDAKEQLFSAGEERSIDGENKHQKQLLEGNRTSADHQKHGGIQQITQQIKGSMISDLKSFISEGQPNHRLLLTLATRQSAGFTETSNGDQLNDQSDQKQTKELLIDGPSMTQGKDPSLSTRSINKRGEQHVGTQRVLQSPQNLMAQDNLPSGKQKTPRTLMLSNSWKYVEQPSLTRLQSIIYHVNRTIKLELDLTIRGRPGVLRPALITQQHLDVFYNTRVKNHPNIGRELEIVEEPRGMYEQDQAETSGSPEVEKKLLANIEKSIQYEKVEREEQLRGPPIVLKYIRSSHLFFNSNFESGNLREVEQVTDLEYNLYLNFDFNTSHYSQWYFFAVRNIKKGFNYTFNIMNLQKEETSYSQGMKPFVYSVKKNREHDTNVWTRGGENIDYYKNNLKTKKPRCTTDYEYDPQGLSYNQYYEQNEPPMVYLNTLSFNFSFSYDEDIVFFSQFQPYTYEDLKDYLFSITKKYPTDYLDNIFKVQKLCNTIEGNTCHILTVCDSIPNEAQQLLGGQGKDPKQVIFLTSRVHPGESNSSFMIQGFIDFILAQTKEAQFLREQFIFKIIPMLNPDGVIRGNYRCNTLGVDLNRRWNKPSKLLHPTIYYAKYLLKQFGENQIIVFCDIHGHSKKRNVFMYGCISPQNDLMNHKYNNLIRMIPYMLGQRNKLFQFNDCKFANEKEKESTARLVMFREFSIINSYTLESTFYAPYNNTYKKKKDVEVENHVKADELVQVGSDLCFTIFQILQSKILKRKFLQQEGPTGTIVPGPPIGVANVQNIVVSLPPIQNDKPKMSDIYKGFPISSTSIGEGNLSVQEQTTRGENANGPNYFPLPGSRERTVGSTQYTMLGQSPLFPKTASSETIMIDYGQSPVNGEALKGQPLSQVIASLPHTHQVNVRDPDKIQQFTPEKDQIQYLHHPLSLKKVSQRNGEREYAGTQEMPLVTKVHHHLLPPTMQKTPLKHKQANKIATSLNGHATMTTVGGGFPMPMTIIAQPTPLQLQAKAAMKTNIMKQSILEAPNQINAILSEQFVPLNKVMGSKNTQQDFFKLYHAGGNFRTVMNSNIIHSPTFAASGTGIHGSQSNSNINAHLANNQHHHKKIGASIHIITESPNRQNQTKHVINFPGGQSSSNVQNQKNQLSARGDQDPQQQSFQKQRHSNKQDQQSQQQLFGLGQGPQLPLSALLGEALGDIQSHLIIPQAANLIGEKLPFIVSKQLNKKRQTNLLETSTDVKQATAYLDSPHKNQQQRLNTHNNTTPLKFTEIQKNKATSMTTPVTKYNEAFFKQNGQDGSQSGKGPLQQAGNHVANNNKIVYPPPNLVGGVKAMGEAPISGQGEFSINKAQGLKQKAQHQMPTQGNRRNIIDKLNSMKLLQPAGQQLISQSSSILQTGLVGGGGGGSPEALMGRPSNPPIGAIKKNQQGRPLLNQKGVVVVDSENQIVYQDYISTPQMEYAETDFQAMYFNSSPNLQNGNQILAAAAQTSHINIHSYNSTVGADGKNGGSRVNLPTLINGARIPEEQQAQQQTLSQKYMQSFPISREDRTSNGLVRMKSNEESSTAGKPPRASRVLHQMASAEIGASFHNSPNPLYIKDGNDFYDSGSPQAKFYSSRPDFEHDTDENLRSKSILQNGNTESVVGGGLTYTRLNDGRGGEFRIFKSPLKPVIPKRESRSGHNNEEELRQFAKLKVKQQT